MDLGSLEVEWISVLDKFNKLHAKYKLPGLSRAEFMLLHLIAKTPSGAVKISGLATDLGVTTPAVSKLLKLLEEKYAIGRVNDITDRRITYIAMTSHGRTLYNAALQNMRQIGLAVVEQVGEQEFNQFFHLAEQMYVAYETVFQEFDPQEESCK